MNENGLYKILLVEAITTMSIGDVSRGYKRSLERQGHTVFPYNLAGRTQHHLKGFPKDILEANPAEGQGTISRMASENILIEAIIHDVDIVVVICGLNVHPISLWLLAQIDMPVAVVFTESPYEDGSQSVWMDMSQADIPAKVDIIPFSNDLYSAKEYGWHYLPPSFDTAIHKPSEPDPDGDCDVLMIGTGWPQRQAFLESVDWTGIRLKLFGIWPHITPESPLFGCVNQLIVDNQRISGLYNAAKININLNRYSELAETPGPRQFELAGCGAFQISDFRPETGRIFGEYIPSFSTPAELEATIRHYLDRPEERARLAAGALDAACGEDFDSRVSTMMSVIDARMTERQSEGRHKLVVPR